MTQQAKKNYFNAFENMNNIPNFMDFNSWREQINRNMQVMSAANHVAANCFREMVRCGTEVLQKQAQNSNNCLKDVVSCNSPVEAHKCSADWASCMSKEYYESAREIREIADKATAEIFDIYSQRSSEVVSEASKQASKNSQPFSSKK